MAAETAIALVVIVWAMNELTVGAATSAVAPASSGTLRRGRGGCTGRIFQPQDLSC